MNLENNANAKSFAILLGLLPIIFSCLAFTAYQDAPVPPNATGAEIYQLRCATCHDKPTARIPPRAQIVKRSTENVIETMTTGTMKQWAEGLAPAQIRSVALYLTGDVTGRPASPPSPTTNDNLCKETAPPLTLNEVQWNGWGRDLDNSRYQPKPGISAADVPRLKVKWAWRHPGPMATGQPTIIGNRLFVTTEAGQLFSLNAQTGCTYWSIKAGAALRSAITVGALPEGGKAKFALYFGDLKATMHSVDADSGEVIWTTKVEDHPLSRITGSPVLYRNRLYVPVSSIEEVAGREAKYECCKFRGSLVALDAHTGKILWKSFTVQEEPKPFKKNSAGTQMYGPAGGAIWSAPTIDPKRKVVYVATGNSYTDVPTGHSDAIMAFDLETGSLKWVNQVTPKDNFLVGCRQPGVGNCPEDAGPDHDFGSSPILRSSPNGKQILLAGQKSAVIYALDPDKSGTILWQVRLGGGGALGGIEWGFTADEKNVYVPVADTTGPQRKPGLTALQISTGKQLWHVPAPAASCSWGEARCNNSQSAAATLIPGVIFSGTVDGHLRAYATKDGTIIWDVDTALPIPTVNGGVTSGGALDGGGPTIANGVLYTNSGYGKIVGQPGHLLLAFTVDGK